MRSKADETFVIVETLICPLQINLVFHTFVPDTVASNDLTRIALSSLYISYCSIQLAFFKYCMRLST